MMHGQKNIKLFCEWYLKRGDEKSKSGRKWKMGSKV